MRVLLVTPPMSGKERYGRLSLAGTYLPPLGLAYLAAAVEGRHDVRIVDAEILGWDVDEVAAEVARWRPAVVGITAVFPSMARALELCRAVRARSPGVTLVLGGPHPSAAPADALVEGTVDAVVIGEGEATFAALLDALERGAPLEDVPGLALPSAAGPRMTGARARLRDLDALPFPARHLLPMARYRPSPAHYRRLPAFSVICGRGCPWRCTFCSCAKVFRGAYAVRSPENVAAEVRHLVERWGAREILFWDDTFGLSRGWTLRLAELLRPIGIGWSAWMRADLAEPEVLAAMAEAGCWHVSYGIESGNQEVLDGIHKELDLEQVRAAFRRTHQAGMEARGTFVLGLPGDTPATMRQTVDLAIEVGADFAQFQFLTPYPGTELWDDLPAHGTRLTRDPSRHTIWQPVFVPRGATAAELRAAHRDAYRRFYLRPGYVVDRLRRIRTLGDLGRYARGAWSVLGYVAS